MSFINDPYAPSQVRYPRAQVMLSTGTALPPPISFDVTTTNNLTADKFNAEFPLDGSSTYNSAWWASQTSLMLSLQIGFLPQGAPSNYPIQYTTLLQGQVDDFKVDYFRRIVKVSGRDLSSNFIDTKLTASYQNLFSSVIVQMLATEHGMQANVDPTTTPVGRYYVQDHTNTNNGELGRNTTEWDFMCYLARKEGYDLFVTGNTVNFKKALNETSTGTAPVWGLFAPQYAQPSNGVSIWQQASNVTSFNVSRSLTLANDIKVTVQGWHSKTGKSFMATAVRNKGSNAKVQNYVFNVHNITQTDAQAMANSLLVDLSRNEIVIDFTGFGDITLTARTLVQVINTNSMFDTTYYVDAIKFGYSNSGFTMSVKAKNHSVQTETTV